MFAIIFLGTENYITSSTNRSPVEALSRFSRRAAFGLQLSVAGLRMAVIKKLKVRLTAP